MSKHILTKQSWIFIGFMMIFAVVAFALPMMSSANDHDHDHDHDHGDEHGNDNAQFINYGDTSFAPMQPGQTRTIKVAMRNNGETIWNNHYTLRPVSNQKWGVGSIPLRHNVVPVDSAPGPVSFTTFQFTIQAPQQSGNYPLSFRMHHDGFFGQASTPMTIQVIGDNHTDHGHDHGDDDNHDDHSDHDDHDDHGHDDHDDHDHDNHGDDDGTVTLPRVTLNANKINIYPGESVRLSWSVTGTFSHCWNLQGSPQWYGNHIKLGHPDRSGSEVISDITKTTRFGIKCSQTPTGSNFIHTQDWVTINVVEDNHDDHGHDDHGDHDDHDDHSDHGHDDHDDHGHDDHDDHDHGSPTLPRVTINANKKTISPGESVRLSWSVTGTFSHCWSLGSNNQWSESHIKLRSPNRSSSEIMSNLQRTTRFGIKCSQTPTGSNFIHTQDWVTVMVIEDEHDDHGHDDEHDHGNDGHDDHDDHSDHDHGHEEDNHDDHGHDDEHDHDHGNEEDEYDDHDDHDHGHEEDNHDDHNDHSDHANDHSDHDHGTHDDNDANESDDHSNHDHTNHDDHDDHSDHGHEAHENENHDDHSDHNHDNQQQVLLALDDHSGHDHDDHSGHDHGAHDDHEGHDHGDPVLQSVGQVQTGVGAGSALMITTSLSGLMTGLYATYMRSNFFLKRHARNVVKRYRKDTNRFNFS